MGLEGGVIPTGCWTSECCGCTMLDDIVETAAGKVKERLHRHTNLGREPFHLAEQRHQMVCADRSRCVIQRSFGVIDHKAATAEYIGQISGGRVTSHGKPAVISKTPGSDLGRW